jgi:hypothetical protein
VQRLAVRLLYRQGTSGALVHRPAARKRKRGRGQGGRAGSKCHCGGLES